MDIEGILSKPTVYLMIDDDKEKHFAFSKQHLDKTRNLISKDFNIVDNPDLAYLLLLDRIKYAKKNETDIRKIAKTNGSLLILRDIMPYSQPLNISTTLTISTLQDETEKIREGLLKFKEEFSKHEIEYNLIIRKNLPSDSEMIIEMTSLNEQLIMMDYKNILYGIKRGDIRVTEKKSIDLKGVCESSYDLFGNITQFSKQAFDRQEIISEGTHGTVMVKFFVNQDYKWDNWKEKRMKRGL